MLRTEARSNEPDVSADDPVTTPQTHRIPTAKLWIFRVIAVVIIPSVLFVALELCLRWAHFGYSPDYFIEDSLPGYVRTNPDFVRLYLPESFDLRPLNFRVRVKKPDGGLRVVVLGESAAQGIPVPSFGFCAQLRAQLRSRYPGRPVEVLNTGIVAINSHVIARIAQGVAELSPDLVVVYMGNNEVVGPYGPGCTYLSAMPPLPLIRASLAVKATRTGQLVARLAALVPHSGGPAPEWGGMAMFVNNSVRGDDPRLQMVYDNYESNLRDIVHLSRECAAQVILCTVASNLKDCPPLLSLHRSDLSAADLKAWTACFEPGKTEWLLGETARAKRDLSDAFRIDPQYAETLFMLGTLDLEAGDTEKARGEFVAAEHRDALRFRPDPILNTIVRKVAQDSGAGVTLVDLAARLGSDPSSPGKPAGRELFFEHVHFDWPGNYTVARQIAEAAAGVLGNSDPRARWLSPSECAAAVGYTAHEELKVLQKIATILTHPPFTHQLTYPEDQARLARELAIAEHLAKDPRALAAAKATVDSAMASDPDNADLAKLSEDVEDAMGNLSQALAQAHRATALEPFTFALPADEAIKLSRLGRYDDAVRLLKEADDKLNATDKALIAPAFADYYTRVSKVPEGRRYLDERVRRAPRDTALLLVRARFLRFAGDTAGAERDLREILRLAPGNTEALEGLVSLLSSTGRRDEAERECLIALPHQSRNQENNLRVAILLEQRGDTQGATRALVAAEESGPLSSNVEVHIAKALFRAKDLPGALRHLALALRISRVEGDRTATRAINQAISEVEATIASEPR